MKIPKPWKSNKLDYKFKEWMGEIYQFMIDIYHLVTRNDDQINQRMSNLIISSCENSENEVVDARTDIDGKSHNSLHDHLKSMSEKNRDKNEKQDESINQITKGVEEVYETIDDLFNSEVGQINIYVSKDGNDGSGDGSEGKPFKTVQKAVDSIPVISVATYFIILSKGAYKEDVLITNKLATAIEIRAYNHSSVSATEVVDTGVFIRSIRVIQVSAYVAVRGLTIIDVANSPDYGIYADRVNYVAVDNLSFPESTKGLTSYTAVYLSASNGTVGESKFTNQNRILYARYTSAIIFWHNNKGAGNSVVLRSDKSIIYKVGDLNVAGTTLMQKVSAGQIFE